MKSTQVFLTAILLAAAAICSSRAVGPVLSGTVTDTSGLTLKDAVVPLESLDGETIFTMTTASGGTHLGTGATIALYVLPSKYELSLKGPLAIRSRFSTPSTPATVVIMKA